MMNTGLNIGDKVKSSVLKEGRICAVSRTDEKCLVEHEIIHQGKKVRLVTNWTDWSSWEKMEEKVA
jgi:hypothetical protein